MAAIPDASLYSGIGRQEPEQSQSQCRFSRARFSNHTDRLPLLDVQRHAVQGQDLIVALAVRNGQVSDPHHWLRCHGASSIGWGSVRGTLQHAQRPGPAEYMSTSYWQRSTARQHLALKTQPWSVSGTMVASCFSARLAASGIEWRARSEIDHRSDCV